MLPEATAWALLREHCVDVLHKHLVSFHTASSCGQRGYNTWWHLKVSLNLPILRSCGSSRYEHVGARLRLALDVINTLCACDGFAPSQNPAFWRSAMAEIRDDVYGRELCEAKLGPLDDDVSFAHYSVDAAFDIIGSRRQRILHGLLTGSSSSSMEWENTAEIEVEAARVRQRVEHTLRGFIVRPVRLLTFRVCFCGWNEQLRRECPRSRPMEYELHAGYVALVTSFVSTARMLLEEKMAMQQQHQPTATASQQVLCMVPPARGVARILVAVNLRIDGLFHQSATELSSYVDLLADGCVALAPFLTFQELSLELNTQYDKGMALARGPTLQVLGPLLRRLGPVHTLRFASWSFSDPAFVGACLSIVPYAQSLRRLVCILPCEHTLVRLAWLAFALSHNTQTHAETGGATLKHVWLCSLGPLVDATTLDRIAHDIQSRVPLRAAIDHALGTLYKHPRSPSVALPVVQVEYVALGTTAVFQTGATLRAEPTPTARTLLRLAQDETLDVVAVLPTHKLLGVVYPGFGLAWVDMDITTTATDAELWFSRTSLERGTATNGAELASLRPVASLSISLDDKGTASSSVSTASILARLFAASADSLCELQITDAIVTRDDVAALLAQFPRLQSLTLRCCRVDPLTLTPLLVHQSQPNPDLELETPHQITTLSLGPLWLLASDTKTTDELPPGSSILAPLLRALAQPAAQTTQSAMARSLCVLHVSLTQRCYVRDDLTLLVAALRCNRVLRHVSVRFASVLRRKKKGRNIEDDDDDDGGYADVTRELLELRDVPLPFLDRKRCALLSVLQTKRDDESPAPRKRQRNGDDGGSAVVVADGDEAASLRLRFVAGRALSVDTLRLVFGFLGGGSVRQIRWD